jgi:hypothetical protein
VILAEELRGRIVVGKEEISRAWSTSAFAEWLESNDVEEGCAGTDTNGMGRGCLKGRYGVYRAMWGDFLTQGALDPWWDGWGRKLCTACEGVAREKYELGRAEIWERLPAMFGLDRWEVLLNEGTG